jgi:hypothetical protein
MFGSIFVEVENQSHLAKVVRALRKVTGVESVERQEASPGAATRGAL